MLRLLNRLLIRRANLRREGSEPIIGRGAYGSIGAFLLSTIRREEGSSCPRSRVGTVMRNWTPLRRENFPTPSTRSRDRCTNGSSTRKKLSPSVSAVDINSTSPCNDLLASAVLAADQIIDTSSNSPASIDIGYTTLWWCQSQQITFFLGIFRSLMLSVKVAVQLISLDN